MNFAFSKNDSAAHTLAIVICAEMQRWSATSAVLQAHVRTQRLRRHKVAQNGDASL